ncbi:divergent polysaccharide deacetylase family protein [Caminibacter pacificus]|uniref:Divergent polysaccharide deacetylase family protein n=1 Tax=Caminibacter pacificus TaxID=1424653 RepID=A0AAJ4RCH2_9BACT|nr:divergent polysaccharide deacetylase family protein [Caminibacter pacificus]QCI27950.1 divergent polysaccharide deacetylase family protein [Caminibacter pacificus]ROR39871.1 hypothetical protein EDC58_0847 [Caminibacter pacificus]
MKKKKTTKKTQPKKKTVKKTQKTSNNLILKSIVFVLILVILGLGAFLGKLIYENKETKKELAKTQINLKELQNKVSVLEKELSKPKPKAKTKPEQTTYSEIKDYEHAVKTQPPKKKEKPKPIVKLTKKPKLVIIIDDVSFKNQVKAIKSIPFAITPSFFPPNKYHPNTAIYAKEFKDYMVHVPMEAISWNKPEIHTLKTTSSYYEIYTTMVKIKKEFPNVKFINNHTGSKFTSDTASMKRLFKVLQIENMGFVDSKTTPHSKAALADKYYDIPLYSRNIFLDNKEDITYIHNQLKKAVNIAKRRGYAIAIGHPHKITFQALKSAAPILKGVQVVTIDQLYKSQNGKN